MTEMQGEVTRPGEAGVFSALAPRAEEAIDPEVYHIVDGFVSENPGGQEQLIPLLHCVQEHLGYLPFPVQEYVAGKLCLSPVEVYSVVSFYHFFNTEKMGRFRIKVCMGTACFVRRAEDVLEKFSEQLAIGVGEVSEDSLFSLEEVRCIGACGLAPVVVINDDVHGGVEPNGVRKIVRKQKKLAKAEAAAEEGPAVTEGETQ